MRKFFCNRLLVVMCMLCMSILAGAQKIPPAPNPPRLVNDFAGILTPDQKDYLERKLVAYDDSTSIQIALVIVTSLDDYEPVEYATKLGREWKVGNAKTNNGVVFLISTEEGKRRVFIAPGYGLEGALPDATLKQVVDIVVIPQFKTGNYYGGIDRGVDAIIAASRGEFKAPAGYANRGNEGKGNGGFVFIIILIVVFIIITKSRGGGGGPKGGMFSRRGYHDYVPPIIFWPGGGGGNSGGGGGWSGGGGGFGGFGGGSFGGGGAGGSW